MQKVLSALVVSSCIAFPIAAFAGSIADENLKAGIPGGWAVTRDGTAKGTGRVDLYPAQWSIKTGDAIRLKVRSNSTYDLRVMRVGWYGGEGATEVVHQKGLPAVDQPYVAADAKYGRVEAGWADTVTIPTDATWTPGVYVARAEQSGGDQATTFFTLRDDGRTRAPIVMVVATATHQAYNTWPGPDRGGKSLYGFNSSDEIPTDSPTPVGAFNQAVAVSFDRPFYVGAGTADMGTWETPMIRFLEKNNWEVAYATDQDLDENPAYFLDRKAIVFVGHSEYWSRRMFDNALAARDAGVNMLFATGNTILWQVRFEPGSGGDHSTMTCYKTSWQNDPENDAGFHLLNKGDVAGAAKHFAMVTRLWKNLEYKPELGLDERRSGMILAGVDSAAAFSYWYPWGDYVVREPSHWIYKDTGLNYGDTIKGVMGYEIDSIKLDDPTFDPYRPKGQVRLATMLDKTGKSFGSSGYYVADSGAEVVALGSIAFSWALDSFASGDEKSVDPRAQKMVNNALGRWMLSTPKPPTPPADAGTPATDTGLAVEDDASVDASMPPPSAGVPVDTDPTGPSPSHPSSPPNDGGAAQDTPKATDETGWCNCTTPGRTRTNGAVALLIVGVALTMTARTRRTGTRSARVRGDATFTRRISQLYARCLHRVQRLRR